jgi:rRNA processing protein Gar1
MPSTVGAVLRLLGNIEEVQFFIKYRKLLKDQPWNHSFKDKYYIYNESANETSL